MIEYFFFVKLDIQIGSPKLEFYIEYKSNQDQ